MATAFPPTADTPGTPPPEVGRPVGTAGHWIGALLILLGLVISVAAVVVGIVRVVDVARFPRLADASGVVQVDGTGGRVVFVVGDHVPWRDRPTGTEVRVTAPDGSVVPTADYDTRRTVSTGDADDGDLLEAVAVATFHADRPGRYRISSDRLPDTLRFGVGRGLDVGLPMLALVAAGGLTVVLAGGVLMVVTAVRRGRRRRPVPAPEPAVASPYGPGPPWPRGPASPWIPPPPPPPGPTPPPGWPPPSGR